MLKLSGALALALFACSAPALASEPETDRSQPVSARENGEAPRTLHLRPLVNDVPAEEKPATSQVSAARAASDGLLSPFTSPAVISSSQASAQTYAGYDSAAGLARARASAEGRLTGFLAL